MSARTPPDANALDRDVARAALNGVVARSIRPVALGVLVLYALYTPSHLFLLPSPENYLMSGAAFLSLVAALAVWRRGHRVRPARAHAVASLLGLILLVNSLLHIYLAGQPEQATNLLLIIVGLGSVLLSATWLLGLIVLTIVGWLGVMAQLGAWEAAIHYGFALASATTLSLVVQYVRNKTLRRLEHLRVREREQRQQLERSLDDLAYSEERFRRFTEASFEGMMLYQHGQILDANPRLATMLGYALGDLQGRPPTSLFDLDTSERDPISPDEASREATAKRRDGSRIPVEIVRRQVPYRGEHAQIAAIRDISAFKDYQHQLEAKNSELERANRMKDAFLANMSHELRTPLTAILGFSEVLEDELFGPLNDQQRQYAGDIHRSGQHLLALINDILDLSKVEADKLSLRRQPTDLAALADEVFATFRDQAKRRDIILTFDNRLAEPTLNLDPVRIRQVLYNYLSNAVKFTPDGGRVGLELYPVRGAVHVRVVDTGIGVAPEHLDRLFKPFSQIDDAHDRHFEGAGLGLALTRRLVELHGGEVWVESAPGAGSTFGFSLPTTPSAPPPDPA